MGVAGSSERLSQTLGCDVERKGGYWSVEQLAEWLGVSRWTVSRRVKADPAFPVLRGFGPDRFPIERVKDYLRRLESGRGKPYQKSADLLHVASQPREIVNAAQPERGA